MLVDLNKVKDKLDKIRTGEITEGKRIGIPDIDNFIRFKEGNFIFNAPLCKTT